MRNKLTAIFNNEFVQGAFTVTTSSLVVSVLNYLFQSAVAHTLGPIGLGEIAALFSYVTIVSVPMTVVTMLIIQKIGATTHNKGTKALALEAYFLKQLKRLAPLLVMSLLLTPFLARITNLSQITAIFFIPIIFVTFLSLFYSSLLQGTKLFFAFSAISVLAASTKFAGVLVAPFFLYPLTVVFIFLVLSLMITVLSSRYQLHRHFLRQDNVQIHIQKKLRQILTSREFLITLSSLLAITAFNNADIIFVKKFFNSADAGLYASWSLFAKIILYLITPIVSVSFVFFAHRGEKQSQHRTMVVFMAIMLMVAGISFLAYNFAGNFIVTILFGKRFLQVVPYLGIASLFGSFYTMVFFINNYFLAKLSKWALILPLSIPLYIVGLFLSRSSIQTVFLLNAYFAIALTFVYCGAYVWTIKRVN